MKVVHLSSEVAPFSKTGGLADVAGALPDALARLGADVTVISPYYPSVCCAAKTEVKASVSVRGASVSVRRLPGPGLVRLSPQIRIIQLDQDLSFCDRVPFVDRQAGQAAQNLGAD